MLDWGVAFPARQSEGLGLLMKANKDIIRGVLERLFVLDALMSVCSELLVIGQEYECCESVLSCTRCDVYVRKQQRAHDAALRDASAQARCVLPRPPLLSSAHSRGAQGRHRDRRLQCDQARRRRGARRRLPDGAEEPR